jgi:hypothetical protein
VLLADVQCSANPFPCFETLRSINSLPGVDTGLYRSSFDEVRGNFLAFPFSSMCLKATVGNVTGAGGLLSLHSGDCTEVPAIAITLYR